MGHKYLKILSAVSSIDKDRKHMKVFRNCVRAERFSLFSRFVMLLRKNLNVYK